MRAVQPFQSQVLGASPVAASPMRRELKLLHQVADPMALRGGTESLDGWNERGNRTVKIVLDLYTLGSPERLIALGRAGARARNVSGQARPSNRTRCHRRARNGGLF